MAAVDGIGQRQQVGVWTLRLVWFLRAMAGIALL